MTNVDCNAPPTGGSHQYRGNDPTMSEAGTRSDACPVCGNPLTGRAAVCLSYARIETCAGCGTGVLLPRPSADDLITLHSTEDYFDHPYFQVRRELTPDLASRYERRLMEIERLAGPLTGKRLLDIGCDTGLFLQYAQEQRATHGVGIDVAERAVAAGRAAGLDLRQGTLEQVAFDDASFDVLCAYDLIEHVSDPRLFIREVRRVLKPGGIAVFETPNYGGLVYRLGRALAQFRPLDATLRAYQERLWPPFHVQYFTTGSLDRMLKGGGLQPLEIRGRELAAGELAVSSAALRTMILGLFGLARVFGSHTLILAVASNPGERAVP
jgi:SAM-dependent methyltransferase